MAGRGRRDGQAPHRPRPAHGSEAIAGGTVNVWLIVATFVLLGANGVFVAKEFSLIASRRTKLEGLAEDGSLCARLAFEAAGELPLQLASSQLGVTMASLGLGAVAEPMVSEGLENAF